MSPSPLQKLQTLNLLQFTRDSLNYKLQASNPKQQTPSRFEYSKPDQLNHKPSIRLLKSETLTRAIVSNTFFHIKIGTQAPRFQTFRFHQPQHTTNKKAREQRVSLGIRVSRTRKTKFPVRAHIDAPVRFPSNCISESLPQPELLGCSRAMEFSSAGAL